MLDDYTILTWWYNVMEYLGQYIIAIFIILIYSSLIQTFIFILLALTYSRKSGHREDKINDR